MQLVALVDFHRALSDPARLRILYLLARAPSNGAELAQRLGLSPATVSHHMAKLRETGAVREERRGTSLVFALDLPALTSAAGLITKFLTDAEEFEGVERDMEAMYDKQSASVLRAFIAADGRLRQIPARRKKALMVYEHIAAAFESGRRYSEPEVNEVITRVFDDYATIRREFIINRFMYRENGVYEMNPREMWTDWRKLR